MKKKVLLFLLMTLSVAVVAQELSYCKWEGSERTRTDRLIKSLSIEGITIVKEPQTFASALFASASVAKVNVDRTHEIIQATQEDILVIKMDHNINWMHFYVYIDYNQDGLFDTQTELVSYTYKDGKTSEGEAVANSHCPQNMPKFVIPSDAMEGLTRLRIKVDWDSDNPCPPIAAKLGENGGIMLDYTINIHELSGVCTLNIEESLHGKLIVTDEEGSEVQNGEAVARGALLNVEAIPEDGYKVVDIKLNGTPMITNSFKLSTSSTLAALFIESDKYKLNWTVQPNGSATVATVGEEVEPIVSGDYISSLKNCKLTVLPNEGYIVGMVEINGKDITFALNEKGEYQFTMPAFDSNIKVHFAMGAQSPTYANPTGSMHVNKLTYVKNIEIANPNDTIRYTTEESPTTLQTILPGVMTVKRGETFKMHFIANSVGDYSETEVRQDLRYNVACLSGDWNRDGQFTAGESMRIAGKLSGEAGFHQTGGNVDVLDFTKEITVPVTASAGEMRVRVFYTDAWTSNPQNSPNSVTRGVIYDFIINVQDVQVPVAFNKPTAGGLYALTNRGHILSTNEEVSIGSKLLIEHKMDPGYQIKTMLLNDREISDNFFVVEDTVALNVEYTQNMKIYYAYGSGGEFAVQKANGSLVPDSSWIEPNQKITYSYKLSEGYDLKAITLNGEDVMDLFKDGSYTADLTENMEFEVSFVKKSFIFTYEVSDDGEAIISIGGNAALSGSSIHYWDELLVSLTPKRYFEVGSILLNGKDVTKDLLTDGKMTFSLIVKGAVDLKIEFTGQKCTLNYSTVGNGVVKVISYLDDSEIPTGSKLDAKETVTVVATPNIGEELISLLINGEDYTEDVDEDMVDIQVLDDVDIVATFTTKTGSSVESEVLKGLTLYPTLFHSSVTIEGAAVGSQGRVYNVIGNCVKVFEITGHTQTIGMSDLGNGSYFIKVIKDNKNKIFKVIKY